jgi:hypothetical protein
VIAGELDTFTALNEVKRSRQVASVLKLFDLKGVPPWTHLLPGFGARRVSLSEADTAAELAV